LAPYLAKPKAGMTELDGHHDYSPASPLHRGSFFLYHNGGTPKGRSFRQADSTEHREFRPDGTIRAIVEMSAGVDRIPD
jgi:hypothetical protein